LAAPAVESTTSAMIMSSTEEPAKSRRFAMAE